MCLDYLNEKRNKRQIKHGWKLFRRKAIIGWGRLGSDFHPDLFPYYNTGSFNWYCRKGEIGFAIGKWIKDPNYHELTCTRSGENYKTGFHFFTNKKDALSKYHDSINQRLMEVRKVLVKDVVAVGHQKSGTTAVAREMFITEEKIS